MTTYPKHADPTSRKAVPSNAVNTRKMKKAARLGANAVPILHARNKIAVVHVILKSS